MGLAFKKADLPPRTRRSFNFLAQYNLLYVTNQKAACTTIKTWLKRVETDNVEFDVGTGIHRQNAFLIKQREAAAVLRNARVFTFVRNPLNRLVSTYLRRIVPPTSLNNAEINRVLGREPGRVTLEEFVEAISMQDPAEMDPHWRPQHINVLLDIVDFDFIGKIENMEADFDEMCRKFDVPRLPLPHANSGVPRERQIREFKRLDRMPATVAKIRSIYARDYESFGYS